MDAFRLSSPPPNYDAIIFDADLTFEDGFFCWEDNNYYPERDDPATSITSKRLFWREASEWMGNALRYRPNDAPLPLEPTDPEGGFPAG